MFLYTMYSWLCRTFPTILLHPGVLCWTVSENAPGLLCTKAALQETGTFSSLSFHLVDSWIIPEYYYVYVFSQPALPHVSIS